MLSQNRLLQQNQQQMPQFQVTLLFSRLIWCAVRARALKNYPIQGQWYNVLHDFSLTLEFHPQGAHFLCGGGERKTKALTFVVDIEIK